MLRAGLDFTGEALALACASHSGEPGHVAGAGVLAAAGLREDDLACPPDFPLTCRACATPRSRAG